MQMNEQALYDAISNYVAQVEREERVPTGTFTTDEYSFLITTTHAITMDAIRKYVIGVKEHGPGFLTEVDHLTEARKEVIDLIYYIAAASHAKRRALRKFTL